MQPSTVYIHVISFISFYDQPFWAALPLFCPWLMKCALLRVRCIPIKVIQDPARKGVSDAWLSKQMSYNEYKKSRPRGIGSSVDTGQGSRVGDYMVWAEALKCIPVLGQPHSCPTCLLHVFPVAPRFPPAPPPHFPLFPPFPPIFPFSSFFSGNSSVNLTVKLRRYFLGLVPSRRIPVILRCGPVPLRHAPVKRPVHSRSRPARTCHRLSPQRRRLSKAVSMVLRRRRGGGGVLSVYFFFQRVAKGASPGP